MAAKLSEVRDHQHDRRVSRQSMTTAPDGSRLVVKVWLLRRLTPDM